MLFQISFSLEWIATLGYWMFLRSGEAWEGSLDLFWSVNAHGLVLLLLLADFVFNMFRFVYSQYFGFVIVRSVYLLVLKFPYAILVEPVYGKAMNWVSW